MCPLYSRSSGSLPAPLPQQAVLAHVGMHKTGTTAMQSVLHSLRPQLAAEGVTYSGKREAHHIEARALTQSTLGWQTSPIPPPDPAVWDDFAAQTRQTPNRVVFSSEFFSSATESQIRQMVSDIGDRLHVLIGVRHLGPVAVSSWQQTLKQGRISTLDSWLKDNFERADAGEELTFFWAKFDPGAAVTRFANAAGPDRVTVVVMREGDRALLPNTFEQLLGLSEGRLAGQSVRRTNRGLTSVEAEVVRQVNVSLQGKLEWGEYDALVRNGAIRRMVENRSPKPDEPRPELPGWIADQVAEEGRRVADTISSSGVRVIGDLRNLTAPMSPAADDDRPADQTMIPMDAMVEAVVGAVAGAAYGTWTMAGVKPARPVRVSETTAMGLAAVLAGRAGKRARRVLRRS
jgi:hypothetical protein